MKITILDDYQHLIKGLQCFELLSNHDVDIIHEPIRDVDELARKLRNTEILVLNRERTEVREELLRQLPQLKLISQTGKISTHLSLSACTRYKVAVAEGVGSPVAPAELTWALLLNTLRLIPQAIEGMKAGKWQVNIGSTVHGKLLGIWGYGKIGQRIAQYARVFGADVLVWGSLASRQKALDDGFQAAASKNDFFERADIVTLHLRLNEQTHGIVKKADLLRMKKDAVLINSARAELIEKGALLESLLQGRPGFAGIDVYEKEPIYDKDYPLFKLPNVVCTPHLGYVEKRGYEVYFGKAFENVLNFIHGNPTNIANPEVLAATVLSK